jgi:hypothetical protein
MPLNGKGGNSMNAFELQSQPMKIENPNEAAETAQTQELDEATYTPEARIEQTGDFKQSEAIQVSFTAVVDSTAAADANEDAVPKGEAQEAAPMEIKGSGERDTVRGNQPRPADGPFSRDGGGSAEGGENITPINLPNIRHEALPGKGQITPKTGDGSGLKIDPVTGQVEGSMDGTGTETETQTNISATMRNAEPGLGINRNTDQLSDVPPPQARPKDQGKVSHMPIGPDVTDEPTTMKNPEKGMAGESKNRISPQQLIDDRFAEQANNAISNGPAGFESGMSGLNTAFQAEYPGFHSSRSGPPVHNYGHTTGDVDQVEDDEEPPENTGPAPLTDPDGIQATDNSGEGTDSVGSVESHGEEGDGDSTAMMYVDANPDSLNVGTVQETMSGHDYSLYLDKNGNYTALHQNSIDYGNPMPYTGGYGGGEKPKDPGTIGGKPGEEDNPKFMPVIRNSGLGYQAGGGINSTDGPSVWDDGNWYGGIFGGGSKILSDNQPGVIDPKAH